MSGRDAGTSNSRRTKRETPVSSKDDANLLVCFFVLSTSVKVLLFPAYASTDLLVHRHWKSVTRHLPVAEWYFDDRHVDTTHTVDYPPGFLVFEHLLANNPITGYWLQYDSNCLVLGGPPDVASLSKTCIAYLRSTVIASDLVLWWGAWTVVHSYGISIPRHRQWAVFLALVFHPGLLWLDHVHFQYNGFLLGILLASLGLLLRANQHASPTTTAKPTYQTSDHPFHALHFGAAILFAALLTLKHLYLTLAPWFFFYLLRRYVLCDDGPWTKASLLRLVTLGSLTVTTLILPFLPFLSTEQLAQIVSRLFPLDRGLTHDYWAANVWALYEAGKKVLLALIDVSLPDVTATQSTLLLVVSLAPTCWQAWRAASTRSNERLLLSFSLAALSSFLTAFHVHEKAILTTLLPLTVWALSGTATNAERAFYIFWTLSAAGVFSLAPLLHQPTELLLKVVTFIGYFAALLLLSPRRHEQRQRITTRILLILAWMIPVAIVLELIPVEWWGRYEFAPLALVSTTCAIQLLVSFAQLWQYLLKLPS